METSAPAVTPAESGIARKPWGIPAILLALVLPLILWGSSLGVAIAEGTQENLSDGQIAASLVFTIILDIVLIALAAGLSLWRYRLHWADLGLRPFDRNLWWLPLAAAASAQVWIIVYVAFLSLVGLGPPKQEISELFDSRALLPLAGLATVIVAPLAEEIFFRGFISAGLVRPFGMSGAMVASGVLFGAFHISDVDTAGLIIPFGLIGVLFAWVYYRTGSLWPAVATHLLFNLVSFAFLAGGAR